MKVPFHGATFRLHRQAFTLMEVLTAMVVISILGLMSISSFGFLRAKAERGGCVRNLQGLYAAAAAYVTDNGSWPQISTIDIEAPEFSKAWIEAFRPYGIGQPNWVCATVQTSMGNPPNDPNKPRIDYFGTGFDDKPSSPWKWPTHPWFVERGDVHGDGNLIILTNGQVRSLKEMTKGSWPRAAAP